MSENAADTDGDVVLSMESSAAGPAPAPVVRNGLLPSASGRSENENLRPGGMKCAAIRRFEPVAACRAMPRFESVCCR
jgi:hypothetical protein